MDKPNKSSKILKFLSQYLVLALNFWCSCVFGVVLSVTKKPKSISWGGLVSPSFPKLPMMVVLYPTNHYGQAKGRGWGGGVFVLAFQRLSFLYGLLCYGRKARSNRKQNWGEDVLWKLRWLFLLLFLWMALEDVEWLMFWSEVECCWSVCLSGTWPIFHLMWPNTKLRLRTSL